MTDQHGGAVRAFAIVSAHGGSGASTVHAMLTHHPRVRAVELGQGAQIPPLHTPLLVARSHSAGMLHACELLRAWHPQVPRPWLVMVRDAPLRPPKAARYRRRAVSGRVRGAVEIPYLPQLRNVDHPRSALRRREVQQAARALRLHLSITDEKGPS